MAIEITGVIRHRAFDRQLIRVGAHTIGMICQRRGGWLLRLNHNAATFNRQCNGLSMMYSSRREALAAVDARARDCGWR